MPADLEKGRQSGNAESVADESDNGADFQPRPSNGCQSSAQSFSKAHSTLFSVFLSILQGENAGTNVFKIRGVPPIPRYFGRYDNVFQTVFLLPQSGHLSATENDNFPPNHN